MQAEELFQMVEVVKLENKIIFEENSNINIDIVVLLGYLQITHLLPYYQLPPEYAYPDQNQI